MLNISIGYSYQQAIDLGETVFFTEQTKMNYRLKQHGLSYKCLYNGAFTQITVLSSPIKIFFTCAIFTIKAMRPHGQQNHVQ